MLHGCASPLMFEAALMRTSFRHQSEAQPPNGTLTAATSPDTPSHMPSHAVGSLASAQPERHSRHQWSGGGCGDEQLERSGRQLKRSTRGLPSLETTTQGRDLAF